MNGREKLNELNKIVEDVSITAKVKLIENYDRLKKLNDILEVFTLIKTGGLRIASEDAHKVGKLSSPSTCKKSYMGMVSRVIENLTDYNNSLQRLLSNKSSLNQKYGDIDEDLIIRDPRPTDVHLAADLNYLKELKSRVNSNKEILENLLESSTTTILKDRNDAFKSIIRFFYDDMRYLNLEDVIELNESIDDESIFAKIYQLVYDILSVNEFFDIYLIEESGVIPKEDGITTPQKALSVIKQMNDIVENVINSKMEVL